MGREDRGQVGEANAKREEEKVKERRWERGEEEGRRGAGKAVVNLRWQTLRADLLRPASSQRCFLRGDQPTML